MIASAASIALPLPATPLVGREALVADVCARLRDPAVRLLTLTGAGGVGKTRLALAVAARITGTFTHGARFIDLAPLADPALVPGAIARAVDVPEHGAPPLAERLAAALAERRLLLLLDNCEHLVDACAQLVEQLLRRCPALRILVTSREPLGVGGERQWRVPPLAAPDPDALPPFEELAGFPAVQLFVERAQAVHPQFELTPANAGTVARICARLDGIPLALELAAARVRVLALEQILTRLDDTLRLLTGGGRAAPVRQQTLQATLNWSYALLAEPERAVFRRLGVFAGGYGLEAVEAICGEDVLDILSRLVDKSLVQVEAGEAATHFRLLEPVRQYATYHLMASGEREEVASRHAGWYLAVAEQAASELRGPDQIGWLSRLDRDYDNLRAALHQAATCGDVEILARLAVALAPYWEVHGMMSEGQRWLAPILANEHPCPVSTTLQARALLAAGRLAFFQADLAQAAQFFGQSMALGHSVADAQVEATSSTWLGFVSNRQREFAVAAQRLEESLALHRLHGNAHGVAWALHGLGAVAANQEDYERATTYFEESLRGFQAAGDLRFIAIASLERGYAELFAASGDREHAGKLLRDGLRGLLAVGDRVFMIAGLLSLAESEAQLGRPAQSARLVGALGALRDAHGAHSSPVQRVAEARLLDLLRPRLGETMLAGALAEGRLLTAEQALAETLSDDQTAPPALTVRPPPDSVGALTPREREVARLLAQGCSDRQIAEVLTIALSTVGSHVHHLLTKLDLHSRWQVGEWARAHGLATSPP